MKTIKIQKPFSIEALKNGAKIETRDGRSVRILCTDIKDNRPIIAAVLSDSDEQALSFYADGTYRSNYQSIFDLVIVEDVEEPEQWADEETNSPRGYGKYVDDCLIEASNHFFSEGEDKYSVADLFYAGVRCGKSLLEKQGENDKASYEIAEKEKQEFVSDGFIKCHVNFQDFNEGETYWLEYLGNDNYNVRSDNLLGKTYHITPYQLYTIFKKQTRLENQVISESNDSNDERIRRTLYWWVSIEPDETFKEFSKDEMLGWLEKQGDKDRLIQELGKYKVKYTQEVLEQYIDSMKNKDDERLRKTTISFLKDFAEQGYENAVECIDWLENQGNANDKMSNNLDFKMKMNFGGAIDALKQGKKVARQSWNDNGMWLWLKADTMVKSEWCHDPALKSIADSNGGEIEALGTICMKTADNKILTGWLASQTDMLSEDWIVVETND